MEAAKPGRALALVASAALLASLTITAAAPVMAKTDMEPGAEAKTEQPQVNAETRAERKQARAEAKAAKAERKAARKAARQQAKAQQKAEKIMVCHKYGTPSEKTLEISERAWPAHEAHGDTRHECGWVPLKADPCTFKFSELPDYDASGLTLNRYPENGGTAVTGDYICGGAGNDLVPTMDGGTFDGADGIDKVDYMYGGAFFDGGDPVFNGGSGNDVVIGNYGGTYNGGPDDDQLKYYSAAAGGTCTSVEMLPAAGCPAP